MFGTPGNLGGNPFLTQSISDSLGDTVNAYNRTVVPGFAGANARSGSFGNSGLAEAQGNSQQMLQQTLARQANDMRSNNYQFGANLGQQESQFGRTLGQQASQFDKTLGQQNYQFGANLGQRRNEFDTTTDRGIYNDTFFQNQQGFNNAISLMDLQNRYGTAALGYGNTIQNTPMDYYSQFTNTANSIGQGFPSANQSGGGGSPLMGALGGAQLGAQFGGWGRNSMGNSVYTGGTSGGWGGQSSPLGSFFYGTGGSGD